MREAGKETMNIGVFLKEHDIKPSYQRLQIYKFLVENKIHPTVDTIYKALCDEIPTLSKTTVYNTLNTFIEKGIVNIVVIEENETRYDADMDLHGHFKCSDCGNVYDIFLDTKSLDMSMLAGFDVKEQHLYFKGVCKNCVDNSKTNN